MAGPREVSILSESEIKKETKESSPVERGVMRPLGFYEVKKRGKWTEARWTKYGWNVEWSNWWQDDADLDGIRAKKN